MLILLAIAVCPSVIMKLFMEFVLFCCQPFEMRQPRCWCSYVCSVTLNFLIVLGSLFLHLLGEVIVSCHLGIVLF